MVAMRWSMRFVGLFSSIILARLLAPEDFGLVAMAMIVVALVDTLASTGVDLALIRERDTEQRLYNAAWTIQVMQNVLVALLMLCAMPFAIDYFDEPKLSIMFVILAGTQIIQGFKNIGIVDFRKDLDFAKEFRFSLYVKLLSFIATVSLAFVLRDYRAIVFGMLSKSVIELVLSYSMHSYRPKFSLSGMAKIWGFSQWLLLSSVVGVVNGKASQFIVGGSLGVTTLGFYYMASQVGSMFIEEIVMPIRRALFPNLSLLQDDEVLAVSAIKILGVVGLLCFPVGVGLSLVAENVVVILFGQNWLDSAPILRWTALFGVVAGISMSLNLILMVKNRVYLSALKGTLEAIVLIPILIWVGKSKDPVDIAMARVLVSVTFLPLMFWFVGNTVNRSMIQLFSPLWRPMLAVGFMYLVDQMLFSGAQFGLFTGLFAHIFIGVVSYLLGLYVLWFLSGQPDSSEKIVYDIAVKLLKKRI
jgi:O-antigen/teichoic acid export membrane protein